MIKICRVVFLSIASLLSTFSSFGQSFTKGHDKINMQLIDNGIIKLGIDLNKGGSITYLASIKDGRNLINSYDLGRQIQMSFYSGPVPYQPKGTVLSDSWKFLGWNPIQSGDYMGNMSRIITFKKGRNSLYVKTQPMQWPLDGVSCECSFETIIKLKGNKVYVKSILNNNRADTTQYTARDQELPAIYTNGDFSLLYSYTGNKPFYGDTLSRIYNTNPKNSGEDIRWASWTGSEHWAALVDKNHWGLGIYSPETVSFIGGFAGNENLGGSEKDYPTGYIAPVTQEILDHNIVFKYNYVLIIDSLAGIRNAVKKMRRPHNTIAYNFKNSRQHWTYENVRDAGWPSKKHLALSVKESCTLRGPADIWKAEGYRAIDICAAYQSKNDIIKLYWRQLNASAKPKEVMYYMPFSVIPDGRFHVYHLLVSDSNYKGMIGGIGLDLNKPLNGRDSLKIKYIRVHSSEN